MSRDIWYILWSNYVPSIIHTPTNRPKPPTSICEPPTAFMYSMNKSHKQRIQHTIQTILYKQPIFIDHASTLLLIIMIYEQHHHHRKVTRQTPLYTRSPHSREHSHIFFLYYSRFTHKKQNWNASSSLHTFTLLNTWILVTRCPTTNRADSL